MIRYKESDIEVQHEVLMAITGMLHNSVRIFDEEEDERMANVVDTMISESLLPQQEIAGWIHSLAQCTEWPDTRAQRVARVNGKIWCAACISEHLPGMTGIIGDLPAPCWRLKLN